MEVTVNGEPDEFDALPAMMMLGAIIFMESSIITRFKNKRNNHER